MGSHSYLQNLGDTYVKNAQLQGQTNFLNQIGHGNTQVDNLSGLAGSVQNFGLQELLIGPEWTWNPNVAKPVELEELRRLLLTKRDRFTLTNDHDREMACIKATGYSQC